MKPAQVTFWAILIVLFAPVAIPALLIWLAWRALSR